MNKITFLCMTTAMLAYVAPAAAQEAGSDDQVSADNAPPPPVHGAATPSNGGEEIIVTATRRDESLQRVPVAVQAVSGEEFENRGLTNVLDIQYAVPSLTFKEGPTVNSSGFAIRGLGTLGFSPSVEQTIGLTIDEIPQGARGSGVTSLVDIAQIEVLRGPQGTLYGRNASAGLITIRSNAPDLDDVSARVRASYGSYNEAIGEAVLNLPVVTDQFGLRFAGRVRHVGSYQTNLTNGAGLNDSDEWFIRGRARWQPTDRLSIDVIGETSRFKGDCCIAALRDVDPNNTFVRAAIAAGVVPSENNDDVAIDGDLPSILNKNHGLVLEANYDAGAATITGLVGHREFFNQQSTDVDYSPLVASRNRQTNTRNADSQELRLTSNRPLFGVVDYVLGLFHIDEDIFREQLLTGRPDTNDQTFVQSNSTAVFSQFNVHATDRLTLVLGGRYNWDFVSQDDYVSVPSTVPLAFATGGSTKEERFIYRTALQYQWTPDLMVYASVASGYKAPAFSAISATTFGAQVPVKPETSTEYELGLRSQLLDHRLTLNLTLFDQDFTNFQAVTFNPVNFNSELQNAGSARVRGIEWEIAFRPVRGLRLSLDGAYVDAQFTDFRSVRCSAIYASRLPGDCPGGFKDATGAPLPNAPRFTSNFMASYETPVSDRLTMRFQGTYSYRSKVDFEPTDDPFYVQKGYGLLGLRVGIGDSNDRWTLSAYATNLLDTHYSTGLIVPPGSIGASTTRAVALETRRRVGVELQWQF
jgi:iron complex outermembrane receptor protein